MENYHSNPANRIGPSTLRLGIVGVGGVTETCHLPALKHLRSDIQVVGLVDPDEHRRRRVEGMFQISQTYASLDQLLQSENPVDAIAVCVPARFHAEVAVAAMAAGKHVLVEKPLTLTLDDADRIIDASRAHPDLKLTVGFNLRHHRLVTKARALIESGLLGSIQIVRTLWTSSSRSRGGLPAWRSRRETGGGVIAELAVHHIDLIRFLTGSQIDRVFTQSEHGAGDDQIASLLMNLTGGASATCTFSETSGDAHEIEIIGSKGRITFSLYQFDSFKFTPAGRGASRLRKAIELSREFPQIWPILRRGGDFHETYRRLWLSFAHAIRHNRTPATTLEDGHEALRAVLAAGASSNQSIPVNIVDAPRAPAAVSLPQRSTPIEVRTVEAPDLSKPQLTAVLATRDSFESIRQTIKHLHAQTVRDRIELLIICQSSETLTVDPSAVEGFAACRVIEIGRFDSVAPANAAGVRAASSPIVVLCEDHAFPDPNWAESLIIAHTGPYAVVGPVVHNANPGSLVSRADFLIGYGEWGEPIKPCEPRHLPGHNSAYKRDPLLQYGERLEQMMEAESVLQWDLVSRGMRLYLDPTARLAHTNFAKLKIWTSVQFHAGRVFGGTRSSGWPLWKRAFYACASPLIPLVRLKRCWTYSRRIGGSERMTPALLTTLLWGLSLDGIGQMIGYAAGCGRSNRIAHEFCRVNHITEDDRRQLNDIVPGNTPSVNV